MAAPESFRTAEREISGVSRIRTAEDVGPRGRSIDARSAPAFLSSAGGAAAALATAAPIAAPDLKLVPSRDATLDINAVVGKWDDTVDAIRRDRPMLGSMLEHCLPTAVTASGTLTLQVDSASAFDSLSAKSADVLAALRSRIPSVTKLNVRVPEGVTTTGHSRMSHETIRNDTIASLRKRDPVLSAAIDELDLALLD